MPLTQVSSRAIEDTHRYVLGASGTDHYTFTGKGLTGAVNDPTLTLSRGHTYIFENRNSTNAHPFYIKTSIANGGTNDAYNTGVTNNGGAGGTEIVFTVPHDAPTLLYYQCSSHINMNGQLKIADALVAGNLPTGVQVLTTNISAGQLVTGHIAAGTGFQVNTSNIADDAVTEDKLANSINTAIAANTAKDLTALSASNLTSGTIPDARFPATLPAASAANLTSLPAANITGDLPAISGANLTGISTDFVKITDGSWTSAVSSVNVDSLDTSTYKYFKMLWNSIPVDQGHRLSFQWRSGGSNLTAASYDWNFGRYYGAGTDYIAENATSAHITDDMGDDGWEGCQLEFTIYPQGTAENGYHGNAVFWNGIYHENATYVRGVSGSLFYDGGTGTHPNGFKIAMTVGNLESGNYVVYGIKR